MRDMPPCQPHGSSAECSKPAICQDRTSKVVCYKTSSSFENAASNFTQSFSLDSLNAEQQATVALYSPPQADYTIVSLAGSGCFSSLSFPSAVEGLDSWSLCGCVVSDSRFVCSVLAVLAGSTPSKHPT